MKLLGQLYCLAQKCYCRGLMYVLRPLFKSYGKNFKFEPSGSYFTYQTISVGSDVYIGPGANFISTESTITIGNKVMFGPDVTMIGGDHNTSVLGRFMYDVHEKRPQDDLPIVVEDDVWVGTGATILKGVTLGRGSIVAAGSMVTKSSPPYAIIGGIPAKVIKWRWSIDEILQHEAALYAPALRLTREALERMRTGG